MESNTDKGDIKQTIAKNIEKRERFLVYMKNYNDIRRKDPEYIERQREYYRKYVERHPERVKECRREAQRRWREKQKMRV